MTKEDNENIEHSTKCWICWRWCKRIDHCHITGKYGVAAHRDCNVNYKIPIELQNLKNYDAKSYYARNWQIWFLKKCHIKQIRKIYDH